MRAVGIRELKNRLSEFLRLVRAGEEVLVTDRGTVIAVLAPPEESMRRQVSPELAALIEEGVVRPGRPRRAPLPSFSPRPGTESAQRALDWLREDKI